MADIGLDASRKPVLYSFRRCPYAMRARMALLASQQSVVLREVELRNKPEALLSVSQKGTVPVLVLNNANQRVVIDESVDIMRWALQQNDPLQLGEHTLDDKLLLHNDGEFKAALDRYKYFDRYPEYNQEYYFQQAQGFLGALNKRLNEAQGGYLNGAQPSALDIAIFPFVRQFYFVSTDFFARLGFVALEDWLREWLESDLFLSVMHKYTFWQEGSTEVLFG